MKTSLRKLRGFALNRYNSRRDLRSLSQTDELAQASQDLDNMRNCYDSLLAAAAATTNTAYEFSESLGELGSCLLEKTASNEDEESDKVLLMLGKRQLELQRMLDGYRSHLSRTITVPCQSLLNELQTVEEMKQECDEKRRVYEYMVMKQREKGRSRSGKGESFTMQQLQEAREQYEEEATLFVFRLKSLKQGQSRSLITQAARHHAAQLHFFRKALKSVEAVEPHVKNVAKQLHIDYQLNELEDAVEDEDEDDDDADEETDSYDDDTSNDGDSSFDYGQNDGNSTDNFWKSSGKLFASSGETKSYTQSAPLFTDKSKRSLDLLERTAPLRQCSTRKLQTYVLPTPGDQKGGNPLPSVTTNSYRYNSSPLERKKHANKSVDERYSGINLLGSYKHTTAAVSTLLLPPLAQLDPHKKMKRQAFSAPLTKKPQPNNLQTSRVYSEPILRKAVAPPLSPTSSPKISELHELPRPPVTSRRRPSSGFVGYSAPLADSSRGPDRMSGTASPLPRPPTVLPRSFSIPSSGPTRAVLPEQELNPPEDSPPTTPMSFSNVQIVPSDSSPTDGS